MYLAARTLAHPFIPCEFASACVRAWPVTCLAAGVRLMLAWPSGHGFQVTSGVGFGGSLLGRMQEMRVYKFKDNYLTEHNFTTYSRNPPQPHTHSSTIIPSYDQHENGARASTRLCTNTLLHVLEAHDLTTYLRPTN